MIVFSIHLVYPVRMRCQPFQIIGKPSTTTSHILDSKNAGLFHPDKGLHDLQEMDRIDDTDPPSCHDPFDRLRVLQVWIHPSFGGDEPGADMLNRLPNIFLVFRHQPGGGQVANQRTEADHGMTVSNKVIGICLPIPTYIGTIRIYRIGPPIIAFGVEIMNPSGTPFRSICSNGHRFFCQGFISTNNNFSSE